MAKQTKMEAFNNEDFYLIQKVWGCLADAVPFSVYNSFTNAYCYTKKLNEIFNEKDLIQFQKNLDNTFKLGIKVDFDKKMWVTIDKFKKKLL